MPAWKEHSERMRAAYDRIAPAWTERAAQTPSWLAELASPFMATVGTGARVLDLGCGPAFHALWFAQQGLRMVGADLSSGMLAHAHPSVRGSLVQADMRLLPFVGQTFRGIWCVASLQHLPKQGALTAVIEMHRVIAPGGALFLAVTEGEGEHWEMGPPSMPVERFFALYGFSEVEALVSAAGFAIQERTNGVSPGRRWLQLLASRRE